MARIGRTVGSKFIVGAVIISMALESALVSADNTGLSEKGAIHRADITIKSRQFHPFRVALPVGRETRLVFTNKDAELHAFVPLIFLEYVPLHVEGNGNSQFGDRGLERVLIPPGGRAEIWFVPQAKGNFLYRCDLPGHQMVGEIIVADRDGGQDTAMTPGEIIH